MTNDISFELYKGLRQELSGYMEKVPAIWLQKFILVGSVIAFIIGKDGDLTGVKSEALLTAVVCAIPCLASLLDAKMLEYGLHARAISHFIAVHYAEHPLVAEWEQCLWGDKGNAATARLVRLRSFTTVAVTALPTFGLILLAGLLLQGIYGVWTLWLGLAVGVLYIVGTLIVWRTLWPSS